MDVKRNISEVSSTSEDHYDKKPHPRPGRKPIDTEPKSKRTAQNRAAQRAYRERKEKKMKDLEDKVKLLEMKNVKVTTETDFLKAQVEMLKTELSRYRGHSDFSDLKLPTKVGALTNPRTGSYYRGSTDSSDSKLSPVDVSSNDPSPADGTRSEFDWMKDSHDSKTGSSNIPDLVSGSSSSTSPLNENILFSPESSNTDGTPNLSTLKSNNAENYDVSSSFNEQVDPFCAKLNESCGTKQSPIPKSKLNDGSFMTNSPFATLSQNKEVKSEYQNEPFLMNNDFSSFNFNFGPETDSSDPLAYLTNTNFDVALAFSESFDNKGVEEKDPIKFLTTEDSVYDPLNEASNFEFNEFLKNSETDSQPNSQTNIQQKQRDGLEIRHADKQDDASKSSADIEEVVPADPPIMRCPEIWERITTHPKYSDIDIDGLCAELKSKAKCSERGFVMKAADVNKLLEQTAIFRH